MNKYSTSQDNSNKNQQKSYNRDFIYTIPSKVLHDDSLTLNDIKIYMMVRSFMDTTGDAYPSNNWIANEMKMDKRTVIRSISHLVEKGYLIREEIHGVRHLRINCAPLPEKVIEPDENDKNDNKSYPHPVTFVSPPRDSRVTPPRDSRVTQLDQTTITSKIIKSDFSKKSVDNFFIAGSETERNKEWESCKRIALREIEKLKANIDFLNVPRYGM